jgi:hypothetical protein
MIASPCCARMSEELNRICPAHANRSDCPDALVTAMNGGYGLMIHDGGTSAMGIAFCPWCGARLPPMER